jgi:hypothetical protein
MGFTTKGRKLIRPNFSKSRITKRPKGAGGPSLARAHFGPPAPFGHFVYSESQVVKEIWAEFHQVIVMKLSVFFLSKTTSFVRLAL